MNYAYADTLVNKIISGIVKFKVKDVQRNVFNLLIKSPTRYHKYLSGEIYNQVYQECLDLGMYEEKELQDFLLNNNLWDLDREKRMNTLREDIDELKVLMFNSHLDLDKVEGCRRVLNLAKADLGKFFDQKNCYNHLTASGFADIEKNKFLIGISLSNLNGEPFVDEDSYWRMPSFILEQALTSYRNSRIAEKEFRWLARNEPWRSHWLCRKSEGSLFGIPSVDMTEEQRSLIIWSALYDNVSENPEQPPIEVINDDDLLDGWFIIQKRLREKEVNKNSLNAVIGNEKISNSDEVFVVANTEAAMKKISSMNSQEAEIIKNRRFNAIDKSGSVSEYNLPDVKNDIHRKRNEMFRDKVLGK